MCAGPLVADTVSNEGSTSRVNEPEVKPQNLQHRDKLRRVKEKYMKIHENNVERDNQLAAQREAAKNAAGPVIETDLLARSTVHCTMVTNFIHHCVDYLQQSKCYRILTSVSQPAHIIVIIAVLCVSTALVPTSGARGGANRPTSPITTLLYLATFVTHIGAQVFMTFVSGLSLYFALPRHAFAEVQRVLFPRYFSINAALSFITLVIFVKHHPMHTWDREISIQIGGMSGAFFLELLIRLYLTPPLLTVMAEKASIERSAGVGSEIACHKPGSLKHCPHYVKLYNSFRRMHATIAVGNILTMACTVLHLHYLASNLCVL